MDKLLQPSDVPPALKLVFSRCSVVRDEHYKNQLHQMTNNSVSRITCPQPHATGASSRGGRTNPQRICLSLKTKKFNTSANNRQEHEQHNVSTCKVWHPPGNGRKTVIFLAGEKKPKKNCVSNANGNFPAALTGLTTRSSTTPRRSHRSK